MQQEIISRLKAEKATLYKKYKIKNIGIFGSFARNEETNESDIDILVEFVGTPGMKEFFQAEEFLEKLLNRKIDMVREKAIRKELKEDIMSEVVYI
jgi:uncharacterized protein